MNDTLSTISHKVTRKINRRIKAPVGSIAYDNERDLLLQKRIVRRIYSIMKEQRHSFYLKDKIDHVRGINACLQAIEDNLKITITNF